MKILLTGGTGFIGSHTHAALRRAGYQVHLFQGDITTVNDWLRNLKPGIDIVIHTAGVRTETKKDFAVNAGAASSLAATLAQVATQPQAIIFTSTQAVYFGLASPFTEAMKAKPQTPYAQSKLQAEKIILKLAKKYALRPVILRLSPVLGTGVRENSHMSGPLFNWTKQALSGEPIEVFQNGQQTRDYIHVADVVSAILLALSQPKMAGIYNVGGGTKVRLLDLAQWVKQAAKSQSKIILKPSPPTPTDPHDLFSDTTKLKTLGWRPHQTAKQAVSEFVASLIV